MAAAATSILERDEVQAATYTLGFLMYAHEVKFGKTKMGGYVNTGLKVLEIAGYANTFGRDPRQGLSEALQGTVISAMSANPVLFGLNVAGDVSIAILPTLRATEAKIKAEGREELLREYQEAMGIFIFCAAYREGLNQLVETHADVLSSAACSGVEKLIDTAVKSGKGIVGGWDSRVEAVSRQANELGTEFGEALKNDKRLEPLQAEINRAVYPSSSTKVMITPPPKFPDLKFGGVLWGGTGVGIGAAVTMSSGITLASVATAGFFALGLVVTSFLINKNRKKKAKEFRKEVTNVEQAIQSIAKQIDDICISTLANADKVTQLKAIVTKITEDYTRHGAFLTQHLDRVYGGNQARPVVDECRKILGNMQNDVLTRIIPALEGKALAFGGAAAAGGAGASAYFGR